MFGEPSHVGKKQWVTFERRSSEHGCLVRCCAKREFPESATPSRQSAPFGSASLARCHGIDGRQGLSVAACGALHELVAFLVGRLDALCFGCGIPIRTVSAGGLLRAVTSREKHDER